jgi:hypothetical protein
VLETLADPHLVRLVDIRHNLYKIIMTRLARHGELKQGPVFFFVVKCIVFEIHQSLDLAVTILVVVVHAREIERHEFIRRLTRCLQNKGQITRPVCEHDGFLVAMEIA